MPLLNDVFGRARTVNAFKRAHAHPRCLKRGDLKLGATAKESFVWQKSQKWWAGKEWRQVPEPLFDMLKLCEYDGLRVTRDVGLGFHGARRQAHFAFKLIPERCHGEYMFQGGPGKPLCLQRIKQRLREHAQLYAEEVGDPHYKYIQTKSERTSRATLLNRDGVDGAVIMEALRMTKVSTYQHYVRLGLQQLPMDPEIMDCKDKDVVAVTKKENHGGLRQQKDLPNAVHEDDVFQHNNFENEHHARTFLREA